MSLPMWVQSTLPKRFNIEPSIGPIGNSQPCRDGSFVAQTPQQRVPIWDTREGTTENPSLFVAARNHHGLLFAHLNVQRANLAVVHEWTLEAIIWRPSSPGGGGTQGMN